MRLMIIGKLEGHITTAGRIAMDRGAQVIHCPLYRRRAFYATCRTRRGHDYD